MGSAKAICLVAFMIALYAGPLLIWLDSAGALESVRFWLEELTLLQWLTLCAALIWYVIVKTVAEAVIEKATSVQLMTSNIAKRIDATISRMRSLRRLTMTEDPHVNLSRRIEALEGACMSALDRKMTEAELLRLSRNIRIVVMRSL